jgi:hydrogenase maturation protein HypF
MLLRRSRGYVPLPIPLPQPVSTYLAVGAQLKNTVALTMGANLLISQHIGDLNNPLTLSAFADAIATFTQIYTVPVDQIACDLHPDYLSTRYATQLPASELRPVQHHHAHIAACMAENGLTATALGVAWDGTGYGPDGTLWGGEFLLANLTDFQRVAHFQPFRLLGGESAIREPRRVAIALLYELWGDAVFERTDLAAVRSFNHSERQVLQTMLKRGINTPWTTSAGRLFDAIAALLDLVQISTFAGQAAMALEFALTNVVTDDAYPFLINPPVCPARDPDSLAVLSPPHKARGPIQASPNLCRVVDWTPTLQAILQDMAQATTIAMISAKFHNTMVEVILAIARQLNYEQVVLSGGCFQNRYLSDRIIAQLRTAGFQPYWHRLLPPNDGGIAAGQAIVAAQRSEVKSCV